LALRRGPRERYPATALIDNKRFLHGREPLPPDSQRLLYRLWINSDSRATRLQIARPSAMSVLMRRPAGSG
jgi:hypothetical protein